MKYKTTAKKKEHSEQRQGADQEGLEQSEEEEV